MVIGDRLKAIRESKGMSQGEIEKRTGLLRCYVSRVENGHTVPAIETLEKFAHALEVPMYALFYDGEEPPAVKFAHGDHGFGAREKDSRTLSRFRRLLGRTSPQDQKLLLYMASKMVSRNKSARTMSYQLPGLDQTWVEHIGQNTISFGRFDGSRPGFISTLRGVLDHKEAHRRHTAAVRRFRRLQRLCRIGEYFSFSRTILLRELHA
jgi:transcriptional regulator with XRE-family HTH domain